MEISIPPISINPEYEAVPKLSKGEFELLTNSIRETGLWDPIIINIKGQILDGHHRWRACQLLGIECPYKIKNFDNILEEKLFVYDVNRLRRQLNTIQKVELAKKKKPILEQLAKLNMSKGGKGVKIFTPLGRVNDQLAKESGISSMQFSRFEYLLDNAPQVEREKLLAGRIKPHKLYGRLRNNAFLTKQIALNKKLNKQFFKATDKITLLEGDFEVVCSKLEADSASLIYTDPLYDEDHLYLYDGLGKVSMELLRPGGSLITYINQYQLFVIGSKLLNAGLKFWSPLYLKVAGNESRIFDRHIIVDIKMLLWFVRGNRPINPSFPKTRNDGKRNYMGDFIESEVPDKRFHNFGQNPKDAEWIMKYLTAPNDLIIDPFVGGGSTAVACMNMKRRFIGIDIDPTAIELTNANLRVNLEINKEEKV